MLQVILHGCGGAPLVCEWEELRSGSVSPENERMRTAITKADQQLRWYPSVRGEHCTNGRKRAVAILVVEERANRRSRIQERVHVLHLRQTNHGIACLQKLVDAHFWGATRGASLKELTADGFYVCALD